MDLSTPVVLFVFILFGLETLARGGGWIFATWRKFQDMWDEYDAEDEELPDKPV